MVCVFGLSAYLIFIFSAKQCGEVQISLRGVESGMAMRRALLVLFLVYYMVCFVADGVGLSYDFYERSCPQVESIVRTGLATIFLTDPISPAAFLRLMFHDCQVQGCDASILLDSFPNMTSEMASEKNFGIRKRESIGIIKSMVEAQCPTSSVSCADILVLAAREAVAASGGPYIRVPLGRRDALTSSFQLADAYLPGADAGVDDMLSIFTAKGMNMEESVSILGAHTLGVSHCMNILKSMDSPHGPKKKTEYEFQTFLKLSCPTLTLKSAFIVNDPTTFIFDNQYYMNSMNGRGLLKIDSEMPRDPRTASIVARFAADENLFFQAFTSAFVKLSSYGVLTGNQGRVLKSCNGIDS